MVNEAGAGQGVTQGQDFARLISIRPNSLRKLGDYYHALAEGLEKGGHINFLGVAIGPPPSLIFLATRPYFFIITIS